MRKGSRNSLVAVLAVSLFAASLQSAAYAGVISTQQYLTSIDREATRARIDAVLARDEVRSKLEQLATDLENVPAGGSVLAVIGIVFLVLLILELVGVIDIFKKI